VPRLQINAQRLRSTLVELAKIGGEPEGGVTRLAYSQEEAQARTWIIDRLAEIGLAARLDAAGNVRAVRAGQTNAPTIMIGSHVDTVPHGGRFDGAAGTIAALEVMRTVQEANLSTTRPIEFVVFAAEESPRFQAGNRFGSRAMAGQVTAEDAFRLVDDKGITLGAAMQAVGLDPVQLERARRTVGEIAAFIELHIEQGTILAEANSPVGIVTRVIGTRRYRIELTGRADHSGGTPMGARRDALAAAAEVVLAVEKIANGIGGSLVGTVTTLQVEPNAMNVVPGQTVLGIDLRALEVSELDAASEQILETVNTISQRRRIQPCVQLLRDTAPISLSERIQAVLQTAAARAAIPVRLVPSHTGHDAISLNDLTDTGMIFVRNPTGQSHSPAESVEWSDYAAATQLLLESVLLLAENSNA